MTARPPSPPLRVAYVASAFPKLTETFILREVSELERAGMAVSLYSIRPRPRGVLHAEALPYLERTHYAPWLGPRHLAALVSLALRRPLGVLRGAAFLARDIVAQARHPEVVAKSLLATPKMFLFAREMEREGVAHVHGHFANVPTTCACLAARVLGITYSFTGHAWDIFVPASQAGLPAKIAGAQFVATCTDFNTAVLARFCRGEQDRGKIYRNYHGLDVKGYVPSDVREPRRIVAGGSLGEKKGLAYLIEAAALLRARGVAFRVEIVGDGPEHARLERAIARHRLGDAVSLAGSMPHGRLVELIRTSALTVLPCVEARDGSMDGIPNILVESLALEVPVISTPISGIPELVVHGETGLLTPPRDPAALADAIESLLRDPARGRALGRNGRARVAAMFDLERNARELAERFRAILAARDSPTSRSS